MAAEWILKEVCISTIPINYQESPNQCWFVSGDIIAIHPTQHYPPNRHNFAINWSVDYWWQWSGYWKKSAFQLFPSIIKKVLISADLSPATSSQSNFQCNTIPPLAIIIIFAINWSVGYWWWCRGYWKKSTFQLFPSIIKKVLQTIKLSDKALCKQQPSNFKHTTIQAVAPSHRHRAASSPNKRHDSSSSERPQGSHNCLERTWNMAFGAVPRAWPRH